MVTSLDRASITYADRLQLLDDYCSLHKIPPQLRGRMIGAMKLKFSERMVLKVGAAAGKLYTKPLPHFMP